MTGNQQEDRPSPVGAADTIKRLFLIAAFRRSTMMNPIRKETEFYTTVERWLQKHFHCFMTAKNLGLIHSRVDVFGVRDVGGDFSGDVEIIAVEVKRGVEPFAT